MFFAPSKDDLPKCNARLRALLDRAPASYEALREVYACVVGGWLPKAGGLHDQPGWFRSTVEWLAARGILGGPLRGGM